MNAFKYSVIIIAVAVILLLLSFASYLFWDSATRTAIAMCACLLGFFGFITACRSYDDEAEGQ